jgi:hypothetical protein
MVGYYVIKELVSSIVNGKNFKSLGMKDFKTVYSNDDVPWPKGTLEEDGEAMDMDGEEPGSPKKESLSQELIIKFTEVMMSLYL